MRNKEITTTLDQAALTKAIKEIRRYKREIEQKTQRLAQIVAEKIATLAAGGFASSSVDVLVDGGAWRSAHASVQIEDGGNMKVIVATGSDVIWCEFGAGVHFNGGAGSSPHPLGTKLGYTIGGYGEGHGAQDSWSFNSASGLLETHGTPASMPMYKALTRAVAEIDISVREVFG